MKPTRASKSCPLLPLPISDSSLNPSFNLIYCVKPPLTFMPHVGINYQLPLGPPWHLAPCGMYHSSPSVGVTRINVCHPHVTVVAPGQGPDPIYANNSVCLEVLESQNAIKGRSKKTLATFVVIIRTWRKVLPPEIMRSKFKNSS